MATRKRKQFIKALLKAIGLWPMEVWLLAQDLKRFTALAQAENPGVSVRVARGLLIKKWMDLFERHRYRGI